MDRDSQQYEVIVVGGGQAGLAAGYFLKEAGRDFTILEAAAAPAAAWRARWDSLRLFTPVRYDSLPGLPFPGDPWSYPTRDDVVAYLTDYARRFELPVELDSRVRRVAREHDGYVVELDNRSYRSEQVVIATGPFGVPRIPSMASQLADDVFQIHSAEYRSPERIPAGAVLIVGGGNTGYQIGAELADTREVHLAIGSRQTPLPQRVLGRDLFRFLDATGLIRVTVDSRLGSRLSERETLIGSTARGLRRRRVRLHERVVDAGASSVRFADAGVLSVANVIWATGFAIDHSWIDAPVFDAGGRVVHRRGVTDSPGLYFLGLPWQHTRGSALLGWVKDDAEHIAAQVARHRPRGVAAPRRTPMSRSAA